LTYHQVCSRSTCGPAGRGAARKLAQLPGMQIPEPIRERMRKATPGAEARKEGVKIAREMLFAARERVQGAYLMPPLGKYDLALEVLDGL
jgi:5,10-methylenetetrahydrofolate reductase